MDRIAEHNISTIVPENTVAEIEKNLGIWEYDINNHIVKWSDGFYIALGYDKTDLENSYQVFFDYLLYHEDKNTFLNFINNRLANSKPTVQIRLLTKENGYQWFESTLNRFNDKSNHKISGSIINIHQYKIFELKFIRKNIPSIEPGKEVKIGSWELDPYTKQLTLSKEFYEICCFKSDAAISIDQLINSFKDHYRKDISNAIESVIKFCKPFDVELLLQADNLNAFWVRMKGVAVIDDYGNCILIKGILQDIDTNKSKEHTLLTTLDVLTEQNKRLQNFAYIVSHNLRTHTGNLQAMITMYDETESQDIKTEILDKIKSVSDSLSATIGHVSDIVKIQADITNERKDIELLQVFKNVFGALKHSISAVNARIEYDFSRAPQVSYLPAYIESIFHNMITNAIKYKHPDRTPHVRCFSYMINDHTYLVFEDNGIGIDLAKHGKNIFGMYKTFHQNTDSRGIGLFITKNQVEALGGTIEVESTVNVGTRFIIKLM